MTLREKMRIWAPVGVVMAALALFVALVLQPVASANAAQQQAAAAAARGLTCTQTDKANGGFVLDCDPAGVTPSPRDRKSVV